MKYINKTEIDKEEGSYVISEYMSKVINKSLRRISGKDKLNRQVEVCNKIIKLLIDELNLPDFNEFMISESAELLLAVLNNIDTALIERYKSKKVRPITSIASNSLFT